MFVYGQVFSVVLTSEHDGLPLMQDLLTGTGGDAILNSVRKYSGIVKGLICGRQEHALERPGRLKTNVKRGSKLAFGPSDVPSQTRSAYVRPDGTRRSSSTAEATRFAAASVVVATLRPPHLSLSILFLQLLNAVDLLQVPITLGFPFWKRSLVPGIQDLAHHRDRRRS